MKKALCIIMLIGLVIPSTSTFAGDFTAALSYMKNGHSEGTEETKTRCVNDGVGIDLGYEFEPLRYNLHKWFSPEVRFGGMLTYTAYETAFRECANGCPESDQRIEHSVTLTGTAKPGVKIGILHPYAYVGAGPDWMQSNGFDLGYFYGQGLDVDITEDFSLGINRRKFYRNDGSTYKYWTLQAMISF